jgi:hypothetical protein
MTVVNAPSAQDIIKGAKWNHSERNWKWHLNLARGLLASSHVQKSVEYFEIALRLNDTHPSTRQGLASFYIHASVGEYDKVIKLQKENVALIEGELKDLGHLDSARKTELQRDLARSHEALTYSYLRLNDTPTALEQGQKICENGYPTDWGIQLYHNALLLSPDTKRSKSVMGLLHILVARIDNDGCKRFTSFIEAQGVQYDSCIMDQYQFGDIDAPVGIFKMAATAIEETGQLDWLASQYISSIPILEKKSRKSVFVPNIALGILYTEHYHYPDYDNPLMDELEKIQVYNKNIGVAIGLLGEYRGA